MRQVNGLVAFEIAIEDIQAVHKLSQNRDDKNYNAIISKLESKKDANSAMIAQEMRKLRE